MSVTNDYLSPSEILLYQLRTDNANNAYARGLAYNNYQQSMLDNSHNAALNDMRRQWSQNFLRTQGGFAHRNLGESGIYHQGLQNWAMNRQSAFGNLNRGYQGSSNGLGYQRQSLADTRDASINQTGLDRQARQDEYAAALRAAQGA